jgi:hypothetical protein
LPVGDAAELRAAPEMRIYQSLRACASRHVSELLTAFPFYAESAASAIAAPALAFALRE